MAAASRYSTLEWKCPERWPLQLELTILGERALLQACENEHVDTLRQVWFLPSLLYTFLSSFSTEFVSQTTTLR